MKSIANILLLVITVSTVNTHAELCLPVCSSGQCVFDVTVRLHAGELGYFEFEGCDGVSPTLGLEIGVTHTFRQIHDHNYYHPIGFAYFPDGAHAGLDELEPGIPPPDSGSNCGENMTCPAPMYYLNGQYLGSYTNDPDLGMTTNGTDFGLDAYEPVFFYPYEQWVGLGNFSVNLRFDQVYDKDIFYFCHIHQFMSGRIKLLQNGTATQPDDDLPEIPYKYDEPTEYDESCGTFNLTDYQLPNAQCPERFICDAPQRGSIGQFAACIEAQNCQMFMGMTTRASARSVKALFLHQMIPHHVNAVHMAKSLLMHGDVECEGLEDEGPLCAMYKLGLSIVNSQNFQIQQMTSLLESYGYPSTDDCVVQVSGNVLDERHVRKLNRDVLTAASHHVNENKNEGENYPFLRGVIDEPRNTIHAADRDLEEEEDSSICTTSTGRFTVRVNLNAGELGYYTFDECGDKPNPTIGLEMGETYKFEQFDRSNYFHPMGFAYFPDGAHAEMAELEPSIPPIGSDPSCSTNLTCPAPMYVKDNVILGSYSNIPELREASSLEIDFGLDFYEPLFFRPIPEWSASNFSIYLKFDTDSNQDIFYFCHIHQFMSGRIKLLKDGKPVVQDAVPDVPYVYDQPGDFDEKCGTFGLDNFQLPNEQCFDSFVCDVPDDDLNLKQYADCIDAMNCHMLAGMTTKATSMSGIALFIHHMVPHHQNAVNMAKATLKFADLQCENLTEESDDCVMEQILREVINGQNYEIQVMYGVLEALQINKTDDCVVTMSRNSTSDGDDGDEKGDDVGETGGSTNSTSDSKSMMMTGSVLFVASLVALITC